VIRAPDEEAERFLMWKAKQKRPEPAKVVIGERRKRWTGS